MTAWDSAHARGGGKTLGIPLQAFDSVILRHVYRQSSTWKVFGMQQAAIASVYIH